MALQPTKWLPRAAGPLADRLLIDAARRAASKAGFTNPVLWVNDPGWAVLLEARWPAIYDITDDWVEADRGAREHNRVVSREMRLMSECFAVVVCSTGLQATKGRIRPVELVQNAVDVAAYQRPQAKPADLPQGRIVIYVGTMHEDRLDVELSVRIAERLAQSAGHLVFVGPNALTAENTRRLEASPGTVILGPRPYTHIPAYMQHADVLIVPHLVDEFTDSLDPIKLYEYEAVGRPIAATPVAGFRELAGTPGVAIVPAGQLAEAAAALMTNPPRVVGPFEPTDWSDRVTAMQKVLEAAAASVPQPPDENSV